MSHRKVNSNLKQSVRELSDELVKRASHSAQSGRLDEAFGILSSASPTDDIRNARAVCLLRMGRTNETVQALRSLVLQPGCTWARANLPVIYYTNFATALLLMGLPDGALETLQNIAQQDHPSVVRLREALQEWKRNLAWWQRFNWKLGITPSVPVKIDFIPGEFVDPMTTSQTTPPQSPPAPLHEDRAA